MTSDPAPTAADAVESEPAAPAGEPPAETTDITAGPGGVMTDEVGVVTGELTLRSELVGDKLTIRVQYKEADEWYRVTGGQGILNDPDDLATVHKVVVGILNRPEG